MKFSDDYGDLKIGDMIYIKGKCGKSWVKYKGRVEKFVNQKYIIPTYLETIDYFSEPNQVLMFPTPHYTYRWKKIENFD